MRDIIHFANTGGREKIMYAGYFPFGLDLERTFRKLDDPGFREEVWADFFANNARLALNLK